MKKLKMLLDLRMLQKKTTKKTTTNPNKHKLLRKMQNKERVAQVRVMPTLCPMRQNQLKRLMKMLKWSPKKVTITKCKRSLKLTKRVLDHSQTKKVQITMMKRMPKSKTNKTTTKTTPRVPTKSLLLHPNQLNSQREHPQSKANRSKRTVPAKLRKRTLPQSKVNRTRLKSDVLFDKYNHCICIIILNQTVFVAIYNNTIIT